MQECHTFQCSLLLSYDLVNKVQLLIFVPLNLYFQLTFFVFSFSIYLTSHLKIKVQSCSVKDKIRKKIIIDIKTQNNVKY